MTTLQRFLINGPLWEEYTSHRWIPDTKGQVGEPKMFYDVSLMKLLTKQSRCRWFETPVRSCDAIIMRKTLKWLLTQFLYAFSCSSLSIMFIGEIVNIAECEFYFILKTIVSRKYNCIVFSILSLLTYTSFKYIYLYCAREIRMLGVPQIDI